MSKRSSKTPYISTELIEALKEHYPLSEYKNKKNIEDIFYYHGIHDVVDLLEHWKRGQDSTSVLK